MKLMFRKIIAVFCTFATIISLTVPAFAGGGIVGGAQTFFEWTVNVSNDMAHDFWRLIFGDDFNAATPEELETAYNDYVTTLPATGVTSDGQLLISPVHSYMGVAYDSSFLYCSHNGGKDVQVYDSTSSGFVATFDCGKGTVVLTPRSGKMSFAASYFNFSFSFSAPVSGYYSYLPSLICAGNLVRPDSVNYPIKYSLSASSSSTFYNSGATVSLSPELQFKDYYPGDNGYTNRKLDMQYAYLKFIPPVLKVQPLSGLVDVSSGDTYNINNRPGSLVGLYGDINGSAFSDNNIILSSLVSPQDVSSTT